MPMTPRRRWTLGSTNRIAGFALLAAALTALGPATAAAVDAEDAVDEKTLYFIGINIVRSLGTLHLSDEEMAGVLRGFSETVSGKGEELDPEIYALKLQELHEARLKIGLKMEIEKSTQYLEEMAGRKGVDIKPSGLLITHLTEGTGKSPKATDKARVNYRGTLRNGGVFDQSLPGQPVEFPLSGVIPCWTEGLGLMKVGGKAQLVCPAEIAYGAQGRPPVIPPGAALTFEVELLEIVE